MPQRAAQQQLDGEQAEAQGDEHEREQAARRSSLKATWNCSRMAVVKVGKRSIASTPNSDSRCSDDEQHPAERGRAQLGQHGPDEGPPRPQPEGSGGVLERLVEAAQDRRHGQEDEGEVGQRGDEDGAAQALQVGADRDPGVAS